MLISIKTIGSIIALSSIFFGIYNLIKFVSNYSQLDSPRWHEAGKPYFFDEGQRFYMQEILDYKSLGSSIELKQYSSRFKLCFRSLLVLGLVIGFVGDILNI